MRLMAVLHRRGHDRAYDTVLICGYPRLARLVPGGLPAWTTGSQFLRRH
ncbi:MAG: hypothetical protein R3A10_04625 [Caldilineaceae bacterium]